MEAAVELGGRKGFTPNPFTAKLNCIDKVKKYLFPSLEILDVESPGFVVFICSYFVSILVPLLLGRVRLIIKKLKHAGEGILGYEYSGKN